MICLKYPDHEQSTDFYFDEPGDFYRASTTGGTIPGGEGTPTGDLTSGGGLSAAYDGNLAQDRNNGARSTSNVGNGVERWVGKDWGGGNEKTILQAVITGPTNTGIHESDTNVRLRIQESATGAWAGEEVTIADTGYVDTSGGGYTDILDCSGGSSARYHRLLIVGSINAYTSVCELEFITLGVFDDMELISETFVALSAPNIGRIGLQVKENEAITINTDLVAEVQRSSGGVWEPAVLSLSSQSDDIKFYEDNGVDVSGQTSGTDMRWRVSINGKNVEFHGVVLQWS